MKPVFLLVPLILGGCDLKIEPSPEALPEATPAPGARSGAGGSGAAPAATPKHGDWLLKDYKNPLDKKARKPNS